MKDRKFHLSPNENIFYYFFTENGYNFIFCFTSECVGQGSIESGENGSCYIYLGTAERERKSKFDSIQIIFKNFKKSLKNLLKTPHISLRPKDDTIVR